MMSAAFFHSDSMRGYIYLIVMICLALYSQNVVKWQVSQAGQIPTGCLVDQLRFLVQLLMSPWVISACLATFLAGLLWMAAISLMDLSKAYPFIALIFVLMFVSGVLLFGESFSWQKLTGTLIVAVGVLVVSAAR
jgi:multidrug transporter EmrE-like cation transporter